MLIVKTVNAKQYSSTIAKSGLFDAIYGTV